MNEEKLVILLWSAAGHRAARFGLAFAADCVPLMDGMIREGASRVAEEEKLGSSAHIDIAETAVMGFTQHMALAARREKADSIGAGIFEAAREFFCPGFWPYC